MYSSQVPSPSNGVGWGWFCSRKLEKRWLRTSWGEIVEREIRCWEWTQKRLSRIHSGRYAPLLPRVVPVGNTLTNGTMVRNHQPTSLNSIPLQKCSNWAQYTVGKAVFQLINQMTQNSLMVLYPSYQLESRDTHLQLVHHPLPWRQVTSLVAEWGLFTMGQSPCIAESIWSPSSPQVVTQERTRSRTMLNKESLAFAPCSKISINCTWGSSLNYLNNRICKVNEEQTQDCDRKCLT